MSWGAEACLEERPAFCTIVWNLLYLDHTQKPWSAEELGDFMEDWDLFSDSLDILKSL